MRYGNFPRESRWLEFESRADYDRYHRSRKGDASWRSDVEFSRIGLEMLLDGRPSESRIHEYLEQHPYLLPGFGWLHHGPYEGIIATKLALGPSFVSDFAFISSNSQTLFFTCVEIESARKKLFRRDGKFHRDYLDARQQISDWLFWANKHSREAIDCWGSMFNGRPASWLRVSFRGILVFGRRAELDSREKQERWSAEASSLHSDLHTMTYDRLVEPSARYNWDVGNDKLVVCSYRERRFFVKRVVV